LQAKSKFHIVRFVWVVKSFFIQVVALCAKGP
jgi:hypothetical protein